MRRLFADKLVFATAAIVIVMAVAFALLRVARIDHPGLSARCRLSPTAPKGGRRLAARR